MYGGSSCTAVDDTESESNCMRHIDSWTRQADKGKVNNDESVWGPDPFVGGLMYSAAKKRHSEEVAIMMIDLNLNARNHSSR